MSSSRRVIAASMAAAHRCVTMLPPRQLLPRDIRTIRRMSPARSYSENRPNEESEDEKYREPLLYQIIPAVLQLGAAALIFRYLIAERSQRNGPQQGQSDSAFAPDEPAPPDATNDSGFT
ncbi:hypothetical protein FB45DRAFT_1043726 [Roridomyces roridus]|uniref:Uncharacterized protein n=1 Tax=Roridomyces roridus TaxID=1738132 RepID=A0AAD7F897_9AGAR|nr:hypothetical protein FB45DRAFT_1043726 [Roridomyces roridus]